MVKSRVVLKVNCFSVGQLMSSDLKKNGVGDSSLMQHLKNWSKIIELRMPPDFHYAIIKITVRLRKLRVERLF